MSKIKRRVKVEFERIRGIQHSLVLIPSVVVSNMKHYYGYQVWIVTFFWLKWNLVFKFGVKVVIDL